MIHELCVFKKKKDLSLLIIQAHINYQSHKEGAPSGSADHGCTARGSGLTPRGF